MDRSSDNKILPFVLISIASFTKFVIYRFLVDLDKGITTGEFIAAYAACVSAAMFLSLPILAKRGILPSIIILIFTDLWLLANCWYFAANNFFIQWSVILFATELRGFENSILSFIEWQHFLFPAITFALSFFLILFRKEIKKDSIPTKTCWTILLITVVLFILSACARFTNRPDIYADADKWSANEEENAFLRTHSPLGHLAFILYGGVKESVLHLQSVLPFTEREKTILSQVCTNPQPITPPSAHLVFVLVESLESWALEATDIHGEYVTPNIRRYICEHTVLYCRNLYSQQQYGRSGDGQLITQTGLLPLRNGIACMSHGDNTYPNYAHFYPNSVIVNPYQGVWNQRVTTRSYGYRRLREPKFFFHANDSMVFQWTREELCNADTPTCVLAITINTHAPFKSVQPKLTLPDSYAPAEQSYLQCVHYFDRQLGRFLSWADTASIMQNSTLVITADHNHFPVTDTRGTCPLIIASPAISKKIEIETAYQMDIFPTLLHAINQNYFWHGLGIDLLSSPSAPLPTTHNPSAHYSSPRSITPHEASVLSDKLIRTNYFSTHTP